MLAARSCSFLITKFAATSSNRRSLVGDGKGGPSSMPKSKSRLKKSPKRVLALPDLEHAKMPVLNSLRSASGQRT